MRFKSMNGTSAMAIAANGILPPVEFQHASHLRDIYCTTVAMYLADNGIVPTKIWRHNPILEDASGMTVAMRLRMMDVEVSIFWQ